MLSRWGLEIHFPNGMTTILSLSAQRSVLFVSSWCNLVQGVPLGAWIALYIYASSNSTTSVRFCFFLCNPSEASYAKLFAFSQALFSLLCTLPDLAEVFALFKLSSSLTDDDVCHQFSRCFLLSGYSICSACYSPRLAWEIGLCKFATSALEPTLLRSLLHREQRARFCHILKDIVKARRCILIQSWKSCGKLELCDQVSFEPSFIRVLSSAFQVASLSYRLFCALYWISCSIV